MGYFEVILSNFLFTILLLLTFSLLNSKFQSIKNNAEEIISKDIIFSYFDKLIFSNKEVFKDLYTYIFEVKSETFGNKTFFINLSFNCEHKLDIFSLRIFNSKNEEIPFKINNFEFCMDESLKKVNISIFLENFIGNEILYIFLHSGKNNIKNYYFIENYTSVSLNYIGMKILKGLDLSSFLYFIEEYCKKRNEVEIEIYENNNLIVQCLIDKVGNVYSLGLPILSLENKKLDVIFRISK